MREYLIFGKSGAERWLEKGVVKAHSPELAIKKAVRANVVASDDEVAAVPTRNWTVAKPSVKQQDPIVELEIVSRDYAQLTVEDVLAEADKEGLTAPTAA